MNAAAPRITLLGSQAEKLVHFLESRSEGHEGAAAVLFRRLRRAAPDLPNSDRYLAVDVIAFAEEWISSSSSLHCAFRMEPLRPLFRRCAEEQLHFGFVHNHPDGREEFSEADEYNERTLLKAVRNRNGPTASLVALLWAGGRWHARVRAVPSDGSAQGVRHVLVVGERLQVHGYAQAAQGDHELLARQAAAFGQPFVDQVRSLRLGVLGASGTGSPTTTLLARGGAAELVIVDPEQVSKNNLNRVRGAGMKDVGHNKAKVAAAFLAEMGLPITVSALDVLVDLSPEAVDALASCDVVFGCTDDQIGRELLLAASYTYVQPLIDVGLGGKVVEDDAGEALLRYHHGRVSTILPEHGECLFCQGVLHPKWIQYQYALRDNPHMTPEEARERYLEGAGEPAPGVAPFTSATADYGVATFYDLLRQFRRFPPWLRRDLFTIDFVGMELRSPQRRGDTACPYCGTRDYLLMREAARLNRPSLGDAFDAA